MNIATPAPPTKRTAAAVAISLAGHAALILLLRPLPIGPGRTSIVAVMVGAAQPSRSPAAVAAAPQLRPTAAAAPTAPKLRHHVRNAVPIAPAPAPTAEPVPVGRADARDDATSSDVARAEASPSVDRAPNEGENPSDQPTPTPQPPRPPPPSQATPASQQPTRAAASAPANGAADGAVTIDEATGGGPTLAHAPSLDPGSCTEHLDYPAKAMLLGKEGVVHMILSIDERGHVLQAKVSKRAGYGMDEVALDAVKTRCRFAPARDAAGKPVSALVEHLFYFRIADFRSEHPEYK